MKFKLLTPLFYSLWNGKLSSFKSFFLLVAMLLVATSNALAQASYETIDGIRYLIDSDAKTATVVASDGEKYSGEIIIPEKVKASDGETCEVVALGDEAFKDCGELLNIKVPATVKTLGNYCFYHCSSLKLIDVPNSVVTFGSDCFFSCVKLESIKIPSSVTSFGDRCFCFCSSLTNIDIPNSITSLGWYCLASCSSLRTLSIPNSVTSLGEWCFQGCTSLDSLKIPSSITSIGNKCFDLCSGLKHIYFQGECPENTVNSGLLNSCIFYVPRAYLQEYKNVLGAKYPYIYELNIGGDSGEEKPVETCATPSITYTNGILSFVSSTTGAEYHYSISDNDITTETYNQNGQVNLSATYHITVYATADGYKQSEKATATLYWLKSNATLEDGTSTNINQAKTRGIVATSRDGIVTLSGLDNGEEVRFYSADGKWIGTTKAIDGVASQAVSPTSLVIAKIGGQAIKIAVK